MNIEVHKIRRIKDRILEIAITTWFLLVIVGTVMFLMYCLCTSNEKQDNYIVELETKIKEKDIIIQDKEETIHMYEVYGK